MQYTLVLAALAAPVALASGVVTDCSASTVHAGAVIGGNLFKVTINGVSDPHNVLCGLLNTNINLETSITHFNPPINTNSDGLRCSTGDNPDPFKTLKFSIVLDKHSPTDQLNAIRSALFDAFNNRPEFGGNLQDFSCNLSGTIA
ncbi:hypothetical protein NQ176_g7182 [Zarea fungicola]|uniref:Uncharacterized protein n=1 Tax=Zarea fungicola TaxID=93591 RepID=A0ACC1MZH5_9HYPO|nr:hypothetical protein NQ176_g7182 [Lecanicillium fungicola]